MHREPPLSELGHFVIVFQAVEATMVDLIRLIAGPDPQYIGALTAELDFNSKARALDVMFTRFAQVHHLSNVSPHPAFHKLVGRAQKLANRRNDIVHSFYCTLITTDGQVGMTRMPTKLRPSEGVLWQPHEDILPGKLKAEIKDMTKMVDEFETYRQVIVDALYPPQERSE